MKTINDIEIQYLRIIDAADRIEKKRPTGKRRGIILHLNIWLQIAWMARNRMTEEAKENGNEKTYF